MLLPQPTTDRDEIRRRLNQDRDWSLYALADLEDGMFEHCGWWTCGDGLALDFRALHIRPMFVMGDIATARALLAAMDTPSGYLNLRHEQVDAAQGIYAYREQHEMNRMILTDFRPRAGETVTLTVDDVPEIEALYRTTPGAGFVFAPSQLTDGFLPRRAEGRGTGGHCRRARGVALGKRGRGGQRLHAPGPSRRRPGTTGDLGGGRRAGGRRHPVDRPERGRQTTSRP